MKKIFTFLLLLSAMTTYAHDFVVNGIAYQISNDACIVARFCTGTNPGTGKPTYDNNYYQGDIIIPSSVTYGGKNYTVIAIGEAAFYKSRITSISIPETVTTIMDGAFEGSELLSAINIGKNITQINDNVSLVEVFNGCFALEEINVDPDNTVYASIDGVLLSKDKKNLFICPAGKTGSYVTPPGVETIKKYAFYKCRNLTDIILSDDVISVEKSIIKNCKELAKLVIGKNVTSIEDYAFYGDIIVKDVYNYSTVPQSISFLTFSDTSGVLHVPVGCTSAYMSADGWKEFSSILDDATTGITRLENHDGGDVVKSVLLNGQHSNGQRGITIIKMKDNSVRKVLTR